MLDLVRTGDRLRNQNLRCLVRFFPEVVTSVSSVSVAVKEVVLLSSLLCMAFAPSACIFLSP